MTARGSGHTVRGSRRPGSVPQRRRVTGNRPQRTRFLVVVGGDRTEKDYFEWVRMTMARGSNLEVRIVAKGKDPNNLIDHAPHLLNQDSADARRDGAPHDIYDQAWVVTDVDEFADQLRTLRRQKRERLDLIISNPCFEVWLVLHLDANPKSEGKAVREQARQLGLVTGPGNKAPVLGKLDGFFDVAHGRAEKLRQRHNRDGQRFPHDAPSTQVDLAVAQIRAAASAL